MVALLTYFSNAFNTVERVAVFTEATICVPALRSFFAKGYGERYAPVFFQMNSRERRSIDCFSRVQQGDAMGTGVVLHDVLAGAGADPRGIRVKSC